MKDKPIGLARILSIAFAGLFAMTSLSAESKDLKKLADSQKYQSHNQNNLTLDDRFESTLFAGPPFVEYVTAVSADIDGTVYVSVDPNGSLGKVKGYGHVMSLKDTNGDGQADQFKKFIPSVGSPRGGHIVAGTYYLLHPPYLTAYQDTNGDGVADQQTLLVNGLGGGIEHPRGADHTTNGARMGIDGWLYISVGDFGMFDAKDKAGNVVRLHGGGVARVRPDGSELEVYVYNTRNQFDVAISPILDLFTRDNTNDGKGWNLRIHHQVPESDFGYPRLYQNFPDEHIQSIADYGGGSGMGCLFLDEPGFPEDLNNRLYTCDWTSGKLFRFDMKQDDATVAPTQHVMTKLERATDIDVDGMSNLYLADWKGGRFKYAGDGVPVSRIHLAKLKGYKAPKAPNLKTAKEAELLKHLAGPSSSVRLQAQQYLLQKKISSNGLETLKAFAKDSQRHLYVRVAALFTLKQALGAKSHALCQTLLADTAMCEFAMKAMTDRKSQMQGLAPDTFAKYLSDANPRVRLQAAISLRRLNKYSEKSADQLIDMATKSWKEDSVRLLGTMPLPHLASRALSQIGQTHDEAWQHYLKRFKSGDIKTQKALSYGLKTIHHPQLVESFIEIFAQKQWSDETRLIILDVLARLSHKEKEWDLKSWWGTRPKDDGPYYEAVTWKYTQPIIDAIQKNFSHFNAVNQLNALGIISRNQIDPSKLKFEGVNALFAAMETKDPTQQHIDILKAAALDNQRDWGVRLQAGQKLATLQNFVNTNIKKPKKPKGKKAKSQNAKYEKAVAAYNNKIKQSVKQRAMAARGLLEVLGQWAKTENTPAQVSGLIQDYWTLPVEMPDELEGLVTIANKVNDEAATLAWMKLLYAYYRPVGIKVTKIEKAIFGKESLHNAGYYNAIAALRLKDPKFKQRATSNLNWDNEAVRKGAKAVLDMFKSREVLNKDATKGKSMMSLDIAKATDYAMKNKGDIELGRMIFNTSGCITCHAVSNAAVQKGPYMGTAGSQFERKFLIESILNPAAAIAQGFPSYLLTTKRGGPYMGFLVDEDKHSHFIMNSAGQIQKVSRAMTIEKKMMQVSQMPPGLTATLNLHEFTSLIEYLVSNK